MATTGTESKGLPVTCQCGHVSFTTPAPKPIDMAHCHCTACRKQSGSAYGTSAYFPTEGFYPLSPELEATLASCTRPCDSGNTMYCYFCPKCGVRIFNLSFLPDGTHRGIVSFKAGCIDGLDWNGVQHIFTRSAVIKLPADVKQYEKLPSVWLGRRIAPDIQK